MLWGVVGLPVLLPLVALLQLLFPGLLRDQWRQYRYAVQVLLTQSTVICLHWALVRWVFTQRPVWLSDDALAAALVAVALWGTWRAWANRHASAIEVAADPAAVRDSTGDAVAERDAAGRLATQPPTSLEFWALASTLLVGLAWAGWSLSTGASPWDQMAVVSAGALAGLAHLAVRKLRARRGARPSPLSTELAFVIGLLLAGAGIGFYARQTSDNQMAGPIGSEWSTFRGNSRRTGTANAADAGPERPQILWTFQPQERKGRITMHSSPCVVDGHVYLGAMHEVLGLAQGILFCVNAYTGQPADPARSRAGTAVWRFTAGGTLKSVFSSPTIAGGRVLFGEGYHQDRDCRLFCLDAQDADRVHWVVPTASHVESTPTVAGNRVFFGAGDEGLICVDTGRLEPNAEGPPSAARRWQVPGVHVDASPALAGKRLFVGSVVGDEQHDCYALAVDAENGEVLWKVPAPLPLPGAPAVAGDRVWFTLGAGKLNEGAAAAEGRLWCLAAEDGGLIWEFRAQSSLLGSPVVAADSVYVCSLDHFCYALDAKSGAVRWQQDLQEPIVASPIVSGGRVFVLTAGGTLVALDAASGVPIWKFADARTSALDAFSSPVLAGGRLYLATGGKLYCIGDASP